MLQNWFKENRLLIIVAEISSLCLMIGWVLYALFGHRLIYAMYEGRSIGFLNRIIEGQTTNPIEYYFEGADRLFRLSYLRVSILICLLAFLMLYYILKEKIVKKLPKRFAHFFEKQKTIIDKHNKELIKTAGLCSLSILLLFCGFYKNQWGVADQKWFREFMYDMDSYIVGRLVKSRQDGIFSSGGFPGQGSDSQIPPQYHDNKFDFQYAAYKNGLTFNSFTIYPSQIGGQGILFSILDKSIMASPHQKLKYFYLFNSLLSAIVLTFVILWFYCQFGLYVSLFLLVSTIFSPWLVVFGRNLWWCIWAFYIPMVACMYFLNYEKRAGEHRNMLMAILVFLAVFIKCLINGCEYITTTLIMMIVPFVYYGIFDKWNIQTFVKRIVITIFSSSLAIFINFIILCYQVSLCTGSFTDGIKHIIFVLGRRTHGAAINFPDIYASSLESNIISVVATYLKGTFLDINKYLHLSSDYLLRVSYLNLIVLFLLASIFLFLHNKSKGYIKNRQQIIALIWATWFSVLAPLSWYIIFKAHSFIHIQINYIVWHMPFTIFGFALCGLFARDLLLILRSLARCFSGR